MHQAAGPSPGAGKFRCVSLDRRTVGSMACNPTLSTFPDPRAGALVLHGTERPIVTSTQQDKANRKLARNKTKAKPSLPGSPYN